MEKKTFSGNYKSLAEIAQFYRQASSQAGFTEKQQYQIETAVDEACSNIIEHAYQGESRGEIECSFQLINNCMQITLVDQGISFDPGAVPIPDVNAPLEERQNNGLGVFFMRQYMDEVTFKRSGKNNVLIMLKCLEK